MSFDKEILIMKNRRNFIGVFLGTGLLCLGSVVFVSCAGQRQGLVCEEIEYRLNNMSYSPDQRYYMEEELRSCREEETKKKGEGAESRKSIYERFASQDSTRKVHTEGDSLSGEESPDIPVSELLKDSSGKETTSIYDRYGSENPETEQDSSSVSPADSTAVSDSTTSGVSSDSTASEVPQE